MTPILAAVPVDTLIWIVLLLIGAIGSIISNARKARRAAQTVQTRRTAAPVPQPVAAPPSPRPTAVPVAPPIVTRRIASSPPPPAPAITAPAVVQPHGTGGFRGMFERGSLVRSIIAAEVLGPPKALQEQSIWSPRHSEPSI
ncbi:MAG: hypothetical protein JO322_11360 [Candidatus Eremiobacteraeota bacterium]|nr:hypothetical protein [Candidatus Eremiobacteraeota bacterium]